MFSHDVVDDPGPFTVLTVIPCAEGPEYREYELSADDLVEMLWQLEDPEIAEEVICVERGG